MSSIFLPLLGPVLPFWDLNFSRSSFITAKKDINKAIEFDPSNAKHTHMKKFIDQVIGTKGDTASQWRSRVDEL